MPNIVLKNNSGSNVTYNGVSTVMLTNTSGSYETYIQPAGTISISASGTYNVAAYASATVTASGGGGGAVGITIVNSGGAAAPFDVYYTLSGSYLSTIVPDCESVYFSADSSSIIALKAPYTGGVSASNSSPVYKIAGGDYSGNETYVLFPTQNDTFTDHQ